MAVRLFWLRRGSGWEGVGGTLTWWLRRGGCRGAGIWGAGTEGFRGWRVCRGWCRCQGFELIRGVLRGFGDPVDCEGYVHGEVAACVVVSTNFGRSHFLSGRDFVCRHGCRLRQEYTATVWPGNCVYDAKAESLHLDDLVVIGAYDVERRV